MTEPAPVPVPWPCPVRMKRWPKVMLSFDACRTIWEAMPKGLSKSQRKDLYQAAKRAVPLYRSLRSEIRLGIPRKKDEREAVVAEIAAFRAAVEAGEHPPRLSDESLGWAIRFSGPEAVDRIERARWETAAAITILEKTQEGIEGSGTLRMTIGLAQDRRYDQTVSILSHQVAHVRELRALPSITRQPCIRICRRCVGLVAATFSSEVHRWVPRVVIRILVRIVLTTSVERFD